MESDNECNDTFLCLSEIFLSMALFEMGRQTAHTIPSDVRQIWLDQCWL